MLVGGKDYLMKNLPDRATRNIYYWYYATQVMRNMNNYEWDQWNRKMRDILVRTHAAMITARKASRDPSSDAWGHHGGRVMQTALSCLTLEIYYRYLPLFKADVAGGDEGGAAAPAKGADGKQPRRRREANRKSQARNPKQIQNLKMECSKWFRTFFFPIWSLLRISDLYFCCFA